MARNGTTGAGEAVTTAVRLPAPILERVAAHAERMKRTNAWATIRQSDALRDLILLGLAAAEAKAGA